MKEYIRYGIETAKWAVWIVGELPSAMRRLRDFLDPPPEAPQPWADALNTPDSLAPVTVSHVSHLN